MFHDGTWKAFAYVMVSVILAIDAGLELAGSFHLPAVVRQWLHRAKASFEVAHLTILARNLWKAFLEWTKRRS